VRLFESGAILNYIADKYGGLDSPAARAEAGKWVSWANASLDPVCFVENDKGQVLETRLRGDPPVLRTLDDLLKKQAFVTGEDFSVADVAIASYLLYVLLFFPDVAVAGKWPSVAAYMKTCAQRPAYAEAFGEELAATLAGRCDNKDKNMFGF